MTGLVLLIAIVVVLALALEVTHRRWQDGNGFHPGAETRGDRDRARGIDEARDAGQQESNVSSTAGIVAGIKSLFVEVRDTTPPAPGNRRLTASLRP